MAKVKGVVVVMKPKIRAEKILLNHEIMSAPLNTDLPPKQARPRPATSERATQKRDTCKIRLNVRKLAGIFTATDDFLAQSAETPVHAK